MPTQKQNQNPGRQQSNQDVDQPDRDKAQRTQKDQGRYQPAQQPDKGDTMRRTDDPARRTDEDIEDT